MRNVNPETINPVISLMKCDRKCIRCAFYDSKVVNYATGLCYYNENGCPPPEEARPTTATNSCGNFAHVTLKSVMGIAKKVEEGKGIELFGLRELNDEQKAIIQKLLDESIAEQQRVRLSSIKEKMKTDFMLPADLVHDYVVELICAHKIELYEQHGYGAIPAQMLCAVGNVPSLEEREEEACRIRAEVNAKRHAGLAAKRALMAEDARAPEPKPKAPKKSTKKKPKRKSKRESVFKTTSKAFVKAVPRLKTVKTQ